MKSYDSPTQSYTRGSFDFSRGRFVIDGALGSRCVRLVGLVEWVGRRGGGCWLASFLMGILHPHHTASVEMDHERPQPQTHSRANHLGLKEYSPWNITTTNTGQPLSYFPKWY